MDVTLQKRCAKFIYVIPEGLRELMSDISREVIRSQPEHMYTFIADYLDALMITRENARVAARLVDSIIQIAGVTVELLQQTGMTREEADRMANIIQDAFKRYMALRQEPIIYTSVQEEEEEEHQLIIDILHQHGDVPDIESAAIPIIQQAFRDFKQRHIREKQLLTGMIDWRVAARSAIYLYRHTGVTIEEANRAATLIKAAYKGYYTRRIMKRLVEEGQKIYDEQEEMIEYHQEDLPIEDEYELEEEEEVSDKEKSQSVAVTVIDEVLKKVIPDEIGIKDVTTPPPTEVTEIQQKPPPISPPEAQFEDLLHEDGQFYEDQGEMTEGEVTTVTEPISEVTTEGEQGFSESKGETGVPIEGEGGEIIEEHGIVEGEEVEAVKGEIQGEKGEIQGEKEIQREKETQGEKEIQGEKETQGEKEIQGEKGEIQGEKGEIQGGGEETKEVLIEGETQEKEVEQTEQPEEE